MTDIVTGIEPDEHLREINAMVVWLLEPRNAEPCATFPIDADRASRPGVYAWHGDGTASELVRRSLGASAHPLFVGQAGAVSARASRVSGATLKSGIVRHHLHGTIRASTFRRSLAALLWDELDLRCDGPRTLDTGSNARLTRWMSAHLSVATVPVDDRSRIGRIESDLVDVLDPALNLVNVANTPARKRLRALRRRHVSVATADLERIDRLLKIHAAQSQGSADGQDFLARRLAHEQRRVARSSTR